MLKLSYTDTSLHIEKLSTSVEKWIGQRVLLAVRVGNTVSVEPLNAAFGLSSDASAWKDLEHLICQEASDLISLSVCDVDMVEIGLAGYWLSATSHSEEGIFVTHLPAAIESLIVEIWQAAQHQQPAFNHCCLD
jgi:hypothetical protein